jgi:hypothetical protein
VRASLDHLVGAREQQGRHRQADLLCRAEIDHQKERGRLLDRQLAGFCVFQDPAT